MTLLEQLKDAEARAAALAVELSHIGEQVQGDTKRQVEVAVDALLRAKTAAGRAALNVTPVAGVA